MDSSATSPRNTLGGGGAVSADEIRERRLAVKGNGTNNVKKTTITSEDTVATTALGCRTLLDIKPTSFAESQPEDDDMEIQAALALSLGKPVDSTAPMQAAVLSASVADTCGTPIQEPASVSKKVNLEDDSRRESYVDLVEEWWKTGDPFEISAFHAFMWDTGLTTDNDKSRWVGQGIDFRSSETKKSKGSEETSSMVSLLTEDYGPWGLTQSHGGPCGVLAAVQAELLRLLLFGLRNPIDYPQLGPGAVPVQADAFLSVEMARRSLAKAIAIVLARSAVMPSAASSEIQEEKQEERGNVQVVLPSQLSDAASLTWETLEPWSSPSGTRVKSSQLHSYRIAPKDNAASNGGAHKRQKINISHESRDERIQRLARATAAFLLSDGPLGRNAPLDSFRRPGGVMLLVMSLVATRGRGVIQGEMDDPAGTKLTAQFGHCGQELINLLVTGQAVSNVFDNTLTAGELTCRGIQSRPDIGYLSQLESLRYCEVGGYYKSPKYPIWVVGSTSHFTVLFGDSSCLKESESDLLLERCRRAFKAVEGGEENGFISSSNLRAMLNKLGVDFEGEHHYSTLAASLEVADAGIILWDDCWKAVSRLMTGASIEQVLSKTPVAGASNGDCGPPLLLTRDGAPSIDQEFDRKPSANNPTAESDEEMAKRLSSAWDFDDNNASSSITVARSVAASPMDVELTALSDEDLARKLQAEWDAELSCNNASSVVAVNGSQESPQWGNLMSTIDDANTQEKNGMPNKLEFEKYGDTFQLFHYNGLRGGTLTPFRVTRLTAEEAVGESIALNKGNNSHSGGSGDLEDVVRTKWPSCMVNWLGNPPPYID